VPLCDLGCLVAGGAVQVADLVVDMAHPTEVDQRELLLGVYDVVGLEVTEQQAAAVQEIERIDDAEYVSDGLGHREWSPRLLAVTDAEFSQRFPTDVLHDDVPGVGVLDEVVDADDVRVLDLCQVSLLDQSCRHGGVVTRIEQALEHDPGSVEVQILGEVDPAEAPMSEAPGDLVLPGDQVPGVQLGREGISCPAVWTETFRARLPLSPGATDRIVAAAARAFPDRDFRVLHHRRPRIAFGDRRHVDQTGSETAPAASGSRHTGQPTGRLVGSPDATHGIRPRLGRSVGIRPGGAGARHGGRTRGGRDPR
jgi:hypothetical protein